MARSGHEILELVGIDLKSFYKLHGAKKAEAIRGYIETTSAIEKLFKSGKVLKEEAQDAIRALTTAAGSMNWYDASLSKEARISFDELWSVANKIKVVVPKFDKASFEKDVADVGSVSEGKALLARTQDGGHTVGGVEAFEIAARSRSESAMLAFAEIAGYTVVVLVDGQIVKPGDEIDADETIEIIYNGQIDHGSAIDLTKDPEIKVDTYFDEGRIDITIGGQKYSLTGNIYGHELRIENDGIGEDGQTDNDLDLSIKVNGQTSGDFFYITEVDIVYQGKEIKPNQLAKIRGVDVKFDEKNDVVTVYYDGGHFSFHGPLAIEAFSSDDKSTEGVDFVLLVDKDGVERLSGDITLKYDKKLSIIINDKQMKLSELLEEGYYVFDADAEEGTIDVKYPGGKLSIIVERDDFPDMFVIDNDGANADGAGNGSDLIIYNGGLQIEGDKNGADLKTSDIRIFYLDEEMTVDQIMNHHKISVTVGTDEQFVRIDYGSGAYVLRGKLAVDLFTLGIATINNPSEYQVLTYIVADGKWQEMNGEKATIKFKDDLQFYVKGEELSFAEFIKNGGFTVSIDSKGKKAVLSSPEQVLELKGDFSATGLLDLVGPDVVDGPPPAVGFDKGTYDYMSENKFNFEAWAPVMGTIYGGLSSTGQTGTTFTVDNNISEVEFSFDFFELGTWDGEKDGEKLTMEVNGLVIDLGFYSHKTVEANSEWTTDHGITINRISSAMKTIEGTGTQTRGQDQVHRFTVKLGSEAIGVALKDGQTQLTVGFDANLGQIVDKNGFFDENYAVASLTIKTQTNNFVPTSSEYFTVLTPQDYYDRTNQQDQAQLLKFLADLGVEADTSALSEIQLGAYFRNLAKNGTTLENAVMFKEFYSHISEDHQSWQDEILKYALASAYDYDTARGFLLNSYPFINQFGMYIAIDEALAALEAVYALSGLPAAIDAPNPGNPTSYGPAYYQIVNGLLGAEERIGRVLDLQSQLDVVKIFEMSQSSLESIDYAQIGPSTGVSGNAMILAGIENSSLPNLADNGISLSALQNDQIVSTQTLNNNAAYLEAALTPDAPGVTTAAYLKTFSNEEILEFLKGIEKSFIDLQVAEDWAVQLLEKVDETITTPEKPAVTGSMVLAVLFSTAGITISWKNKPDQIDSIAKFIGSLASAAGSIDTLSEPENKPEELTFPDFKFDASSPLESFAQIINEAYERIAQKPAITFSNTWDDIDAALSRIDEESTKAGEALEKFTETVVFLSKLSALTSYDFDRSLAIEDPSNYDESDYKDREKERLLESQINEITSEWDDEFEGIIDGVSVDWVVGYSEIASRGPEAWKDQENQLLSEGVNRHEFVASAMNIVAFKAIFSGGALDELGENDRKLVVTWERDTRFNERYEEVQNFDLVDVSWG